MKLKNTLFLTFLTFSYVLSFSQADYIAHKNIGTITVDGILDEAQWEHAEVQKMGHFYKNTKKDHKRKSSVRILWDEKNIYLFFDVKDGYIQARTTERDGPTYFDDCAEIFLIPVPENKQLHFCFETNVIKTTNDLIFINDFANGKHGVFKGYNPEFKVAVTIDGTLNDNTDIDKGWTMEMAIPLKSFNEVIRLNPIKEGAVWEFLAVRQDRDANEGNYRATAASFPIADFNKGVHQPKEFGKLVFEK